jgi:hypothetical protein
MCYRLLAVMQHYPVTQLLVHGLLKGNFYVQFLWLLCPKLKAFIVNSKNIPKNDKLHCREMELITRMKLVFFLNFLSVFCRVRNVSSEEYENIITIYEWLENRLNYFNFEKFSCLSSWERRRRRSCLTANHKLPYFTERILKSVFGFICNLTGRSNAVLEVCILCRTGIA